MVMFVRPGGRGMEWAAAFRQGGSADILQWLSCRIEESEAALRGLVVWGWIINDGREKGPEEMG